MGPVPGETLDVSGEGPVARRQALLPAVSVAWLERIFHADP
jgi:hypothetical protein